MDARSEKIVLHLLELLEKIIHSDKIHIMAQYEYSDITFILKEEGLSDNFKIWGGIMSSTDNKKFFRMEFLSFREYIKPNDKLYSRCSSAYHELKELVDIQDFNILCEEIKKRTLDGK